MPYIKQQDRDRLGTSISPRNAGELNYRITQIINYYLGDLPGYKNYNEVIGVLECAKLELYRRRVVILEELKMKENGDVYP